MSRDDEIVKTLTPVIAAFNRLQVPYYIGGSVASSYHGAVDIFISRGRVFDLACMHRAEKGCIGGANGSVEVPVATLEDTIICKLEWYRLTDETSERQWDDVSRLIRLAGGTLDRVYLERSAQMVGVSDLLNRLLSK